MSELLQLIVIVSAWSWGVYNAFSEGQIFGRIGNWIRFNFSIYNRVKKENSEYYLKPIIGCPVCMPSVHGTALYIAFSDGHYDPLTWIVTIVCASGLNFVLKEFIYED
jgi:hypothetical protein